GILRGRGSTVAEGPRPRCEWRTPGGRLVGEVDRERHRSAGGGGPERSRRRDRRRRYIDIGGLALGILPIGGGHRELHGVATSTRVGMARIGRRRRTSVAKVPQPRRYRRSPRIRLIRELNGKGCY